MIIMKLKLRIIYTIIITFVIMTLTTVILSLFYNSESPESVKDVSNFNHRKATRKRTVLGQLYANERYVEDSQTKKRKHKNRNRVIGNDSNVAAEVTLPANEYEELFDEQNVFSRKIEKLTDVVTDASFSERRMADTFSKECTASKYIALNDNREKFPDLVKLLTSISNTHVPEERVTIQEIHEIELEKKLTQMEMFHLHISNLDLYEENDTAVDVLLRDMATMPIVNVVEKVGGTQLKLVVTFEDGSQALSKPMRFSRNRETDPNHFYFVDYERHNSEIAAFHLDRILGFRRCPPVVGRKLNITTEIYSVANEELSNTFFISPANNLCFHGHCSYYCDTSHAVCGQPDLIESSLAAYLPPDSLSGRKSWKNPWRRSYHKRRKAAWETDDDYCDVVRQKQPLYDNTQRLADLIDMSVLDFLMGNMDRHHYETFKIFGNDSFILHLDHGRGFGRANHDETSILAPLYQCCFIKFSTFRRLLQLQLSPRSLSVLMRCSLYTDPLRPVLLDSHLRALDRRLQLVLHVLRQCIQTYGHKNLFYFNS